MLKNTNTLYTVLHSVGCNIYTSILVHSECFLAIVCHLCVWGVETLLPCLSERTKVTRIHLQGQSGWKIPQTGFSQRLISSWEYAWVRACVSACGWESMYTHCISTSYFTIKDAMFSLKMSSLSCCYCTLRQIVRLDLAENCLLFFHFFEAFLT